MTSQGMSDLVERLRRKRMMYEEEGKENEEERNKVIVGVMSMTVTSVAAWYHDTFMVRDPPTDWDDVRKCYLNRLYNGTDDDCVEQLRSHENAKRYRWKVIPNWDDIVDLCAKDRATGEGAEMVVEANEVMDLESVDEMDTASMDDDKISTSSTEKRKKPSTERTPSRKKGGGTSIAAAVDKMASSFVDYMKASSGPKGVDPKAMYEEVFVVDGLDDFQKMKACMWFMDNEKQFSLLKSLPMERKKEMILMLI